jgi:hypothetical protein
MTGTSAARGWTRVAALDMNATSLGFYPAVLPVPPSSACKCCGNGAISATPK